jgi:hypothetical protein
MKEVIDGWLFTVAEDPPETRLASADQFPLTGFAGSSHHT